MNSHELDVCQTRCENCQVSFANICICCSYDEIEMYEYSEEQNICDPSPCINGGTCVVVSPDVFSCECLPGHRGELCEKGAEQSSRATLWDRFCESLFYAV